MDDLQGANALLTGAVRGLGRHIALALAAEGVRLAVSGRDVDSLERLCRIAAVLGPGAAAGPSYVLSPEEKVPSRVFQAGSTVSSMLQRSASAMSDS